MRVRVFRREGNNQYYFQFLRDDGQVILNSEGYTTEAARDNGVQSVINNAGNADRYEAHSNDGGGFYFILNAGNGQEIGRSVTFRKENSRNAAITLMQGEATSVEGGGDTATTATTAETTVQKVVEPYKASGNEDNYKPLNFYETRITGVDNGFDSFSEGGEHYFTYNLGGNVYLISEGYTSTGARDNGIQSVTNNMNNEARYQRQQDPKGHFFFNLRAGNNKEIATSRWFDDQGNMDSVIARMVAGLGLGGRRVEEGTQLQAANRDANIAIAAPPAPREMGEPKKKRKKRDTPKKPKAEKVYVANGNYLFNDLTYQIFRSGNNRYYFTFKTPEEKTLFLNADVRGFETQEQAQAVVDQIMLYAPYEDNFEGKQARNGKFYFYIKGEDGKNIGKSFFYGTAEDMQSSVGLLLGSEAQIAALKGRAANLNEDEYLACSAYASNEDGFHKFTHDNGEHYFGYNHGGKTYLRSEGYTTTGARDNGIASVQKNAPIEARWKTRQDEADGMWYYALRAGNNQEIALSCGYESEAAMTTAWEWMRGEESTLGTGAQFVGGMWYSGAWLRRKAEEEAAAKRAAEAAAAKKAEEEAAATTAKKAAAAAAAVAAAALAAKQKEEEAVKAQAFAAAEAEKNKDKEDDYLTCKAYEGHAVNDKRNNVAFFKGEDGQYYFALYNEEGGVRLRSEGFKTAQERDQELSGVVRLKDNQDFYKRKERGKYYMDILYDETGREVGRSCLRNAEEEAAAAAALIAAKRKAEEEAAAKRAAEAAAAKKAEEEAAAAATAKKAAATAAAAAAAALALRQKEEAEVKAQAFAAAEAAKNKDKEDDYLPCKAYQGHAINDKRNNVAFFKGEDGQFYFALYDDNGNVRLRSEGFKTAQERDQELSGVVRLKDNQDFYKRLEKGKYYMDILYDETGREVGRSCLRNVEEEKAAAALLLKQAEDKKAAAAAAAATAAAAALAATQKKEEEATALALAAKQEKKRKAAAAAASAAVAATAATKVVKTTKKKEKVAAVAAATTEGSGTMGWLPWLLLPLLLAAVFYFTKGCYGCDDAAAGLPTPMDVSSIVTPPVRANAVADAAARLAATTCACNSDCKVMSIPTNGRAQILTRLGTNPEFGNAHDLTGPQFLGRLRNRYATEPADTKFLDELFTCMGYTNGFADATADIFSVVTLPNGKTGNMGYGANHGTTYATLNAKDAKDLEAFKIEAANGCDVHFMKTCGNHFFFCN